MGEAINTPGWRGSGPGRKTPPTLPWQSVPIGAITWVYSVLVVSQTVSGVRRFLWGWDIRGQAGLLLYRAIMEASREDLRGYPP